MPEHLPARGARILIVEPSSSGAGLPQEARALGFEVVVASADRGDRRLPDQVREHLDQLVVVDTNDEDALAEAVAALHRGRPFQGIVPGFEFYVDTVARLAERLGLPGLPAGSARGLRHKTAMRELVGAAGLRIPRYAEVSGEGELAAAAELVGFPAVLKPAESAGSVHVSRVDSPDGLRAAYRRLRTDTRTDFGRGLDGPVLLEEYLDGPEISVEGYVEDGRAVVLAVTTKMLGPEPYFVELGQVLPRTMDPRTRAAVDAYVDGVCTALGLTLGPFHCELRLPAGEPVLIEIGARLAGHRIPYLVELVTGTSQARIMLAAYTGLRPQDVAAFSTPSATFVGTACFTAPPELTAYSAVEGLGELRADRDTLEVELYVPPGERIPPPEDFRCFLGHAVFQAESYEQALTRWHAMRDEVHFV
ncbi:ATP-grasp domain-containing protein [Kitasatospora mediocidica]|uniref:ATP-grasp domain-containing protein n=1 Tax=Kitasatospora mediocidica TaxID=58352 RepID=UPI0012FB2F14|nr:ATP-grasp domain-containing protein [Kitasatospora mediocidica]